MWITGALSVALVGLLMSTSAAATFVYVGNADSNDVHVFDLNPGSGDLTLIEKVAIPAVSKPGTTTPMAVSPDRRFLFVGVRGEPLIAATFAIDPKSGKLTHLGNGPLADAMAYISADRSGKYLLSASYPGHKVAVNPIGVRSVVDPPKQVVPTAPNAHAILADPGNRYVLATSLGGDIVNQYRYDPTSGMLSPNDPPSVKVKDKAGPRHLVFHPNAKLVYLVCELDASVYVFDYDPATGRLSQKQVTSAVPAGYEGKVWAADIHVTPDGRFVYVSERNTSTLTAFKVDPASGTLTTIGSYPTEKQPRGFNIDPSGRYLLAAGQLSDSLTSYAIDQASGKLKALRQYPVGKNPNWVEIVVLP